MSIESDLKKAYEDVIEVFYTIAQDFGSTFDKQEMIGIALETLKKVVDFQAISFLTYSEKSEMYIVDKNLNYTHKLKKLLNNMIREGLINWAAKLGKPFINIESIEDIKTTVIVPLVYKEKLEGAIVIHTKKNEDYFDQNRIRILSIISNQLTIAFENVNLYNNLEKRNAKLKSLKSYMDNIVKSMTNGVMVLDNNEKLRVFNKKSEELLSSDYRRILGKHLNKTKLDENFIKELLILKNRTKRGEIIIDREFVYKANKEDEGLPIGISTNLLKEEEKELGIIFVLRDLRESKELKELKRVDKLKDEFLSMVSHELRTPLTSIKAYTETLLFMVEDVEDGVERDIESEKDFLNIINEESERLSRLINDVLDLSKIEAGKMTFILEEIDTAELINRAVKNMTGFAEQKNIKLSASLKENLPKALIDKDRTIQVLSNLINNSLKFTHENGEVIVISGEYDKDFLKISVKDTGVGIREEDLEKVFEKFKQSENILTRESGGTGLGLPICKNIVEYYGGELWVESEYGKGSEFIFTIPIVKSIEGGE